MAEKFLFDLIFHDGPLTSVFDGDNGIIIYDWVGQHGDIGHDWNVFRVNPIDLKRYISHEMKFCDLFKAANSHRRITFDTELNILNDIELTVESELESNPKYGDYEYDEMFNFSKEEIESWMNSF